MTITKADLERWAARSDDYGDGHFVGPLARECLTLTAELTAAEQRATDLARRLAVVEGAAEKREAEVRLFERTLAEKMIGAWLDRRPILTGTPATPPAPRVIASDEFAKKGRAMFVEAGFKDVASACGDAPADDGGPRECNWVGCHRSFGHDGAHERWALGPIASPAPAPACDSCDPSYGCFNGSAACSKRAPAPDAGEAAPQSVWITCEVPGVARHVWQTQAMAEESARWCRTTGMGNRTVAGPYVLVTVAKTDEDRARTIVDKDMCAHHDEYMVERITALLATIRDAAHRAEVAEAEARVEMLEAALITVADLTTGRRAVISASVHDTAMAALAGAAKP